MMLEATSVTRNAMGVANEDVDNNVTGDKFLYEKSPTAGAPTAVPVYQAQLLLFQSLHQF